MTRSSPAPAVMRVRKNPHTRLPDVQGPRSCDAGAHEAGGCKLQRKRPGDAALAESARRGHVAVISSYAFCSASREARDSWGIPARSAGQV
jgi:hypothetical protein